MMYLINNLHLVLTLTVQQQDYTLKLGKKHTSCYLLWQLIYSSPTEIGGKLLDMRCFLVLVGYMLTIFVPEMYGSGKPLLWGLFDVRILYMEELTTCHVVLVKNASGCSEILWYPTMYLFYSIVCYYKKHTECLFFLCIVAWSHIYRSFND